MLPKSMSVPVVMGQRRGRFASLALRVAAVLLLFPSPSKGDAVPLAGAGQFAVFHLGCGTSGTIGDLTVNTGTVAGDVGIGGGPTLGTEPHGFGKFQKGSIDGRLLVDQNAAFNVVSKNFTVTGGTVSGQDLRSAVDDALAAQASAAALGGTALGNFTGGSLAAGVYQAASFDLNKTTLTITGGASERFILNVSGEFDFHQSEIVLQGGITADNVLFNVLGSGDPVTVGHGKSVFLGDLLAADRSIIISELGVDSPPGAGPGNPGFGGRMIGGLCLDLIVHSGAQVTPPAECAPGDLTCCDPASDVQCCCPSFGQCRPGIPICG